MKKSICFALGLSLLASAVYAEDDDTKKTTMTNNGMPKEEWMGKVKEVVSKPICEGFFQDASISSQLSKQNITMEKCVTQIPALTDTCEKKYKDSLPATITRDDAGVWGKKIGECIGMEFAKQYLYPQANADAATSTTEVPKE